MKSILFMLSTAILVHHTMEYEKAEEVNLINTEKPPKEYKGYSHSVIGRETNDLTYMTNDDDTKNLQPYCRRSRDGEKVFRKRLFKNVIKWAENLIGKGHKQKQKHLNPNKQKFKKSTKRTTKKLKVITKKPRHIRTTRKPKTIKTTRKSTYIRTTRTQKTIQTSRKPKTIRTTSKPTTIGTTTKPTTTRTTTKPTTIRTTMKPTIISTRIEGTTTRDGKIIEDMEYAFDIVESILKNMKRFTKSSSSNNIEITVGSSRSTSIEAETTNDDYYEVTGSTLQELTTTKNYDYEGTETTSAIRKGKRTTRDSNSIDIDHDYYYYL